MLCLTHVYLHECECAGVNWNSSLARLNIPPSPYKYICDDNLSLIWFLVFPSSLVFFLYFFSEYLFCYSLGLFASLIMNTTSKSGTAYSWYPGTIPNNMPRHYGYKQKTYNLLLNSKFVVIRSITIVVRLVLISAFLFITLRPWTLLPSSDFRCFLSNRNLLF